MLSWNVNGFRAVVRKGFYDFLENEKPEVLALQEIKMDALPTFPIDFEYKVLWNPAQKKGYAGTALFTKKKPRSYLFGIDIDKFDSEGRVITTEFDDFFLVNSYYPNSQRELTRLDFKHEFNLEMIKHLEKLRKRKPVVLCGDFNVAHQEIDLARPKDNVKNAGFTSEEREDMSLLLSKGYVDTFRQLHPDKVQYSWWTYRSNARARNVGWRIDYFVVSKEFLPRVKQAFILDKVMGSDHAPVGIEIQ